MFSELTHQPVFKTFWACFVSCCSWLVGGFDVALLALLILYLMDFALGFYGAWMNDCISREKLRQGVKKLILYTVFVVSAQMLDLLFQHSFPSYPFFGECVRNLVISYAALCDFLSVCAHLDAQGLKLPVGLIRRLRTYKDKMDCPEQGKEVR